MLTSALRLTAPKGAHPVFLPVAGLLSYTNNPIFVYECILFGLSYTKSAVFVFGNKSYDGNG